MKVYIVYADVTFGSYSVIQGVYSKKADALAFAKRLARASRYRVVRDGDLFECHETSEESFVGVFGVSTRGVL